MPAIVLENKKGTEASEKQKSPQIYEIINKKTIA